MSTQAVSEVQPRPASSIGPAPQPSEATRPVLRALPRLRRRHRGLTTGIIALMAVALAVVLAVNIHVSNTQYHVVQLHNDHQLITQQNQSLQQQVQHLRSPQVLSDSAVSFGMVMPAQAGALTLETGAVEGEAAAADSADRPSRFVASPVTPGEEVAPGLDVAEQAAEVPSGLLGSGALNTLSTPAPGQNGEQASVLSADGDSGFSPQELNGGTIPAPGLD